LRASFSQQNKSSTSDTTIALQRQDYFVAESITVRCKRITALARFIGPPQSFVSIGCIAWPKAMWTKSKALLDNAQWGHPKRIRGWSR